jgi:hypothetical protein
MIPTIGLLFVIVLVMVNICCIAGNMLSAYVFSNKQFKIKIFKYFMINSIVDGVILFLRLFAPIIETSAFPELSGSYLVKLYELYVVYYVARALDMLSTILSLWISVERLLLIKSDVLTSATRQKISRAVVLIGLLPFILSMPSLFSKKIFKEIRVCDGLVVRAAQKSSLPAPCTWGRDHRRPGKL